MDIFKLRATLGLDSSEYEQGLDEAKNTASSVGSVITGGLKTISAIGAAAVGTATTAIGALGMQAVKSYGNYEQLVGGIETLFGTQGMTLEEYANKQGKTIDEVRDDYQMLSATEKAVIWDSNQAWKTAGMSNTEYMETVSGFAAALKQSCDTVEDAGEAANIAVRDMADNSSKMGTSMESIKDAYAGFAKQNYTMLDNLKLGYGGTKTEMERLLADAQELSGVEYDINNLSDVYDAIHVIQDDLGITGTTAKEAMFTLEGSANATKAAWQNVVTAIAGGGDLQGAFDGLIESVFGGEDGGGLLNNVIPIIETTMEGIGSFLGQAAPYITEQIPALISAILPTAISLGTELLSTIVTTLFAALPELLTNMSGLIQEGLGSVLTTIDDAISNSEFGQSWESIKSSVTSAVDGIKSSFDTLAQAAKPITDAISSVVSKFQEYVDSGDAANDATTLLTDAITLIGEGISLAIEGLASFIETGIEFVDWLTSGSDSADIFLAALTGVATIIGLITAALEAQAIAAAAHQAIMLAVQAATNLVTIAQTALNAVMALNPFTIVALAIAGLVAALIYLYNNNETVKNAIDTAWQTIVSVVTTAIQTVEQVFNDIAQAISDIWNNITTTITTIVNNIITFITTTDWLSLGAAIITGIGDGIASLVTAIPQALLDIAQQAIQWVEDIDWLQLGKDIIDFICDGIDFLINDVPKALEDIAKDALQTVKDIDWLDLGKNIVDGIANGVKNAASTIIDAISSMCESAWESVKEFFGIASPSKLMKWAGKMVDEGFAVGISKNLDMVDSAIDELTAHATIDPTSLITNTEGLTPAYAAAGYTQTVNIYAPTELDPSEVARQTRNATRDMVLELRGRR